jgi:hypothetical protein
MPCKTWPTNDVLACKFEVNSPLEVDLGLKPQGIRLPSLRDWLCVLGGIQQPRSGDRCQPPRSRLRLSVGINTTIATSDGPQQTHGDERTDAGGMAEARLPTESLRRLLGKPDTPNWAPGFG